MIFIKNIPSLSSSRFNKYSTFLSFYTLPIKPFVIKLIFIKKIKLNPDASYSIPHVWRVRGFNGSIFLINFAFSSSPKNASSLSLSKHLENCRIYRIFFSVLQVVVFRLFLEAFFLFPVVICNFLLYQTSPLFFELFYNFLLLLFHHL